MSIVVDKRSAPPSSKTEGGIHTNVFGCEWRTDQFVTEQFRSSFLDVPTILDDWMSQQGGLSGKAVLDFGCGECVSGLGVALKYPTSSVVGMEVVPRIHDCLKFAEREISLNRLPDNLQLKMVKPGEEAVPGMQYDFIYSWSVFEHINQNLLPAIVEQLRRSLKPSGRLLIQIAPLYYSSEGSHLLPWTQERWGHLFDQDDIFRGKVRKVVTHDAMYEGLMQMYSTLNRLTYQQLAKILTDGGLKIEKEYFSREEFEVPAGLLDVYQEDALKTKCVVYQCVLD